MSRCTLDTALPPRPSLTGLSPSPAGFPKTFLLDLQVQLSRSEPRNARTPVWPLSISLAATLEIDVSFSSSPYLDVSVQAVPFQLLWIHKRMTEYCSAGFPHSDILGSMAAFASPGLFVDRYVLHRLPMPRHSPCALISLTFVRIMCPLVLVNFSTRLYCSVYPFQKNQLDICYIISLFPFHIYLYSVFKVHGGLERTRTSDLTLIRRAL